MMKTRKGYEVANFKSKPIRLLREGGRNGIWICLYDLCHVVKRPMMMETREAMNLCPSNRRIIFKKGDKPLFAIHPYDVPKLLHLIKKESQYMETLCEELEAWASSLSGLKPMTMFEVDKNAPVTFHYKDKFPITFKSGNGKVLVNAKEMVNCFGKSAVGWLRLSATEEFRKSLVTSGKSEAFERQVVTVRGSSGGTWVEIPLAVRLAHWLSTEFSKWFNERLRELVDQGFVDIDISTEGGVQENRNKKQSIELREKSEGKNEEKSDSEPKGTQENKFEVKQEVGLEGKPEEKVEEVQKAEAIPVLSFGPKSKQKQKRLSGQTMNEKYQIPQTYAEALRYLADRQDEIDGLKENISDNQHKVEFYEQFVENRDWFKSSTLADELNITTRALHKFLKEEKICKYDKKRWVVHGYHSSLQCDVPYYWTNKKGKTNACGFYKRWTPAGREYIIELWKSRHGDINAK